MSRSELLLERARKLEELFAPQVESPLPETVEEKRLVVGVDFDGVISNSIHGGYDVNTFIFDPVPGVVDWIHELVRHFDVVIFSARELTEEGKENLGVWLHQWGFPTDKLTYTNVKLPAIHLFIDDRGCHFDGQNFPSVGWIKAFKPWNRV